MISKRAKHLLCAFLFLTLLSQAREIHVSKSGSDSNSGNAGAPYLTISKAADVAVAGDTITIQTGTYREWVKPPRGGSGEDQRITYRAATGAKVEVKGSERITSWERQGDGTWEAEVPNSMFDGYNPYEETVDGLWMKYGQWHHLGAVYLDGVAFSELEAKSGVTTTANRWWCSVGGSTTTIVANFGSANPNTRMTEINVRESIFMPTTSGLDYITVRGLIFRHAAPAWAPPTLSLQMGAVGPRMGKSWVIEQCEITDSRNVGIILGIAPGYGRGRLGGIDNFGDHIVRNNIIRRCGQGGIAGEYGATRCLITGNLVEETNHLEEFGGYETAALKFHHSVDLIISGNLIRGVRGRYAAYGIWIDYENQGTRITGNIIHNTDMWSIFLEMNHGPILIDNNILVGKGIRAHSSNSAVLAHNLFLECKWSHTLDNDRRPYAWEPHTTEDKPTKLVVHRDNKWFNNVMIKGGLGGVSTQDGYEADYNLFLDDGASKSRFGDANSEIDTGFDAPYGLEERELGVSITFTVNDDVESMTPDMVTGDLVGYFDYAGQTIEDRFGNPISIDRDFYGEEFSPVKVGPFAGIKAGENTISWDLGETVVNTPATLTITSHGDEDTAYASEVVIVKATALDDSGIKSTWLKLGDNSWLKDTEAPYEWNLGKLALGEYTIRVNAIPNDGLGTVSKTFKLTVIPDGGGNNAPEIVSEAWASPAVISVDGTTTLSVVASDADGDALTNSWSKKSGPGTVDFATQDADVTDVSFSAAGTYTLEVTVSDGTDSVSSEVTVTVTGVADELNVWFVLPADPDNVPVDEDVIVEVKTTAGIDINRIWLRLDGVWVSVDKEAPYQWNLGTLSVGKHELLARATPEVGAAVNGTTTIDVVAGGGPVGAVLSPVADAYVRGGSYADNNYGTENDIQIKHSSNLLYTRYSFLRFDLSSLSGTINAATLRLKVKSGSESDTHTAYFVSNDSWSETGITFSDKPSEGASLSSASSPAVGDWLELDITDQVKTELAGDDEISIVLIGNSKARVFYHSREAADAADRPQLVIE